MVATLGIRELTLFREALAASWGQDTAYQGRAAPGNPALGQCYPTSWLIQQLDPKWDIVRGTVTTPDAVHTHFWNALRCPDGQLRHLDLTWAQFEPGAQVREFDILDRMHLGDSAPTVARCQLLFGRIVQRLALALSPSMPAPMANRATASVATARVASIGFHTHSTLPARTAARTGLSSRHAGRFSTVL